MTTILLITPVLRTKNLLEIGKNIVERFKSAKELVPFWILAFDKYHADISDESISVIRNFCNDNSLQHHIYFEGVEGATNYGGALMNFPLKDIKQRYFKDENPLVYVLDDDNIIHKNFIPFIESHCLDNEFVWWLNMLDEFGEQRFCRPADRLAYVMGYGINKGYRIIHRCSTCDPSQVVIRLNKILELGGYGNTREYDFDFMNKIYRNQCDLDTLMRYQGAKPWIPDNTFYLSCYHNGLVTKENLQSAIEDLEKNFSETKEDSYIRIHTNNCNFNLELTNDEVLKILKDRLNEQYNFETKT